MEALRRSLRGTSDDRAGRQLNIVPEVPTSHPSAPASTASSRSALRKRQKNLSYREYSSSDNSDEQDSEEESPTAPSAAATAAGSRPARVSLALRSSVPNAPPSQRRTRASARQANYAEDSSTDEFEEDESVPSYEQASSASTKRRLVSPDPAVKPVPKTPRSSSRKAIGRPGAVQLPSRKELKIHGEPEIPSDGIIPPWQNLPYEILLSIFRYALSPTHDEGLRPTANVNWLVRASRVCRAFVEPAISALYESPPLLYKDQPHDFLDVVSRSNTFVDYKYKVKRLELDSKRTLAYSHPGRGNLDISALVSRLPNLSVIDICSGLDRPPYRLLTQKGRWSYPENLFHSLTEARIRLKEWRWAGHMIGKTFPGFEDLHLTAPFQSLRSILLSHLWLSGQHDMPGKGTPVMLPTALSSLTNLDSLTLVACHSDGWEILDNLSNDLKELAVIKCPTFDANILQAYLLEHGRNLIRLVLNHNHALDLTWLVDLKFTCPKLQALKMDLTYFSTALLAKNSEAEPFFSALLYPEDVPSWPSTLVEIEMLNLRKWSSDAAVTFFESILSCSGELRHLKKLVIKAMIDISWRDRAKFREKWISALTETFLRKPTPPSSHLASSRVYREWKVESNRILEEQREKVEASKSDSDRRVTRLAKAELEFGSATASEGKGKKDMGTCEVVEISIDNMRPTEIRLSEADFMDSEISGDEEWTGRSGAP